MIIDEKNIMHPPPSYLAAAGPPPGRRSGSLDSLPSHLLLQIVYSTFPQTDLIDQAKPERQRKTLYWLATTLRLVSRTLYVTCMHVLRSTYLPAYDSLIRPPYSSDPFPLSSPAPRPPTPDPHTRSSSTLSLSRTQSSYDPLQTVQRETAILDLFIALKVREDVWADDSELHLERDESFKDLFYLRQPRSRLEDLVRIYGIREGVITTVPSSSSSRRATASTSRSTPTPPTPATPPPPPTPTSFFASLSSSFSKQKKKAIPSPPLPAPSPRKIRPLQFAAISVSFSPRKVGIVLDTAGKRTVVETARARDEKLEAAARRLVKELKVWLTESAG